MYVLLVTTIAPIFWVPTCPTWWWILAQPFKVTINILFLDGKTEAYSLNYLPKVTQLMSAELGFELQFDSKGAYSCCLIMTVSLIALLKSLWFKRQSVIKSQTRTEILKALPALSGIKHFVRSNNSVIIANVSTFAVTTAHGSRLQVRNFTDYWLIIGFM